MPPAINVPFVLSVAGAFVATAVVSRLYVWPALRAVPRHEALRILAAPHAFRFLGMNFLVTGFVSPRLDAAFASQVGWGDLIAAVLALLAMAALSWRRTFALPVVWIFNLWGTADLLNAYYKGATQVADPGLFGAGTYIPAVFVPILLVSHAIIFILLCRTPATLRKSAADAPPGPPHARWPPRPDRHRRSNAAGARRPMGRTPGNDAHPGAASEPCPRRRTACVRRHAGVVEPLLSDEALWYGLAR